MNGLELDRRNDLPIAFSKPDEGEKYAFYPQSIGAQTSQIPISSQPKPFSKRFYGLRLSTVILSVTLAVVTVLAIIAAAVGGSLATRRGHRSANTVTQPTSSPVPPATNCTFPATNTTVSTLPTSDCDRIGKTYVSTIGTHTEFNVFCESDLGGNDFLGVFVYFFEDCIETCASFNFHQTNNGTETASATCFGVAFALDFHKDPQDLGGNCFLKDTSGITATHRNYTSAASLIRS